MTREEQIYNAAFYYNLTTTDESDAAMRGFSAGAEWADANRWVKVEDGLPEVGVLCNIRIAPNPAVQYEIDYMQRFPSGKLGFTYKNVTHWSLFPEPPKAEQ